MISTDVQQYSLTPTASRKSTKTIKSTRLTIEEGPEKSSRKKSGRKRPFSTGGIRLHKKLPKGIVIFILCAIRVLGGGQGSTSQEDQSKNMHLVP